MTRKPVSTRMLLFAALAWIALVDVTRAQSQDWKEYVSENGKFSVSLPGAPTTGYKPGDSELGAAVTYVTNFQQGIKAWEVAYFDLPTAPSTPNAAKKLLELRRDRNSADRGGGKSLIHLGYPALEFKSKVDERGRVQMTRIILVNQRVYEVWVVTDARLSASEDVTKFFDSFKPIPLTDEEVKEAAQAAIADKPKSVPRKINVSPGVLQDRALKKVQPVYPAEARDAKISGEARVRVLISEAGEVLEAEAVDGPSLLRESAVAAAKMWAFKPIELSGMPVKVAGVLVFKFTLK